MRKKQMASILKKCTDFIMDEAAKYFKSSDDKEAKMLRELAFEMFNKISKEQQTGIEITSAPSQINEYLYEFVTNTSNNQKIYWQLTGDGKTLKIIRLYDDARDTLTEDIDPRKLVVLYKG
jgi:uncharacterized membrane-anchored protein